MHGQLKPHQIDLLIGSGPVRDEFSQKVKELDRRLKMNGMNYQQWDTLNDRQHEIFTDNLFLDGECATSPDHYVRGAVESCGCPDTEEDLHHHSPVLMREIEKQQEMLPDMKVKIGESLGFLNEMIDKELRSLLEQPEYRYTQKRSDWARDFNVMTGGEADDEEGFEELDFDKEELPPRPEKKSKKKKKTQSKEEEILQARLATLAKMEKGGGNAGDKYELAVLKLLIGDLPGHTLLSARDVVAGSTAKADAAMAIDGKPYDVELKLGATDPMGSGNIYGEFEWLPEGQEGKISFTRSDGLPQDAFEIFLNKYLNSKLPQEMANVRTQLRKYDPPASGEDKRLVLNSEENFPKKDKDLIDNQYYLRDKAGKAFNGPKFTKSKKTGKITGVKPGKAVAIGDEDYKRTALQKFTEFGAGKYPGYTLTAAWNLAGSKVGEGLRRLADRFSDDTLQTSADFIQNRYFKKGVYYIQIGPGKATKKNKRPDPKGLYYFGDKDPAGLKKYGVLPFDIGENVDFEIRLGAYGSGQSHTDSIKLIKGMDNLTDQEKEYLLSQPRGSFVKYVVRASARIPEDGAVLKQSDITIDTKEGVLELVNKLCDDGRFTGVPSLSREGEVLLPAALSYCVLRNLDSKKKNKESEGL